MKKATKKITVLSLLLVLAVCVVALVACKGNPLTRDDIENQGYTVMVKYDFNGGINNDALQTVTIYVRPNSRIPQPGGVGASFGGPTQQGKTLRGFYKGTKNDSGEIEYADTPWNFQSDKVTESITLYALWWDNYVIAVHCDDDEGHVEKVNISRDPQTGEAATVESGFLTPTLLGMSGRTIISYYTSASRQPENEITFPRKLDFHDEEGGRVIDIYVESREGAWMVIRTADEFATAISNASAGSRNFYIKNDIDMSQTQRQVKFPDRYSGTFDGNGKTISNLTITQSIPAKTSGMVYLGLFRELEGKAKILNVNFKDVALVADTTGGGRLQDIFVGMLAGYVYNGATLTNVTLSGTLSYKERTDDVRLQVGKLAGDISSGVDTSSCHYDDVVIQVVE